jgi:hypothetical protein
MTGVLVQAEQKGMLMALKAGPTTRARTVGHISREAQQRIDRRVKKILDRRAGPVERARRAARRLSGG